MDTVPKVLMALVIVMMVIFAVFGVVSNVIGNQGDSLLDQGGNVEEGLDCVFSNKGSADEECLEDSSGGGDSNG